MKNLKRYFVVFSLMALVPMFANAAISVKDTTTDEVLRNQGYSTEVSKIIQVRTKDPATPIPREPKSSVWKKTGWCILKTIDPTLDDNKFNNHDIKYFNSVDDL